MRVLKIKLFGMECVHWNIMVLFQSSENVVIGIYIGENIALNKLKVSKNYILRRHYTRPTFKLLPIVCRYTLLVDNNYVTHINGPDDTGLSCLLCIQRQKATLPGHKTPWDLYKACFAFRFEVCTWNIISHEQLFKFLIMQFLLRLWLLNSCKTSLFKTFHQWLYLKLIWK